MQIAALEDPRVAASLVTLLRALAAESVPAAAGGSGSLPIPPSVQVDFSLELKLLKNYENA